MATLTGGDVAKYIGPAAASGKLASKVGMTCVVKSVSKIAGFVLASITFSGESTVYSTTGDKLQAL